MCSAPDVLSHGRVVRLSVGHAAAGNICHGDAFARPPNRQLCARLISRTVTSTTTRANPPNSPPPDLRRLFPHAAIRWLGSIAAARRSTAMVCGGGWVRPSSARC